MLYDSEYKREEDEPATNFGSFYDVYKKREEDEPAINFGSYYDDAEY